MTSAFRDHSVAVRFLADPSLSLLRGTPRAGCDVVDLSEEAEERTGVRLTQRPLDVGIRRGIFGQWHNPAATNASRWAAPYA